MVDEKIPVMYVSSDPLCERNDYENWQIAVYFYFT